MFNIPFESIFFYIFGFTAIIFSIFTVTAKKLVHSAVYLMVMLTTSAALYLILSAEFLAGIQMLLYVGGVLILVIFAIMLTSSNELTQTIPERTRKISASIASLAFFGTCVFVFNDDYFKTYEQALVKDEIASVGKLFLNYGSDGQIISFELISIILLVSLIGGIVIGRKDDEREEV